MMRAVMMLLALAASALVVHASVLRVPDGAPLHQWSVPASSESLGLVLEHHATGDVVFRRDPSLVDMLHVAVYGKRGAGFSASLQRVGNLVYVTTAAPVDESGDESAANPLPAPGVATTMAGVYASSLMAGASPRSAAVMAVLAAAPYAVRAQIDVDAELTVVVSMPPSYRLRTAQVMAQQGRVEAVPDMTSETTATCHDLGSVAVIGGCPNCCGGGGTCDISTGQCACEDGLSLHLQRGCGCPDGMYGSDCTGMCSCPVGTRCVDGPHGDGSCVCDDGACDDGNACTVDECSPTLGCTNTAVSDGTSCSDGNVCNGVESCYQGLCQSSSAPSCSDGNPCTEDLGCHPTLGCQFADNTAACDDGNACTHGDVCSNGVCMPGAQVDCNDGDACTSNECLPDHPTLVCRNTVLTGCDAGCNGAGDCPEQPCHSRACVAGTCVYTVDVTVTTGCDDGDACNGVEVCTSAGVCVRGLTPECDDGNACTVDSCDATQGCVHVTAADGASCSNGNACDGAEQCSGGVCAVVPGSETACMCTALTCDDGNPCTLDVCDPIQGCVNVPDNSLSCSDGNACNGVEQCRDGLCVNGSPVVCDASDVCHNAGVCDPATGECSNPAKADGVSCSDGDACNGLEACLFGVCVMGSPVVCDDGNECTSDSCDATTGDCIFTPNTIPCDDGNQCTEGDVCGAGVCAGAAVNCDDGDACTSDACATSYGCVNTLLPACNGCTSDVECMQACHTAVCNTLSGRCEFVVDDTVTAGCDDGDACNGVEACSNGVCVSEPAPQCDDGNACTQDSCDTAIGCVNTAVADGTSCSDGNACNGAETCAAGVCTAGTAVVCTAASPCHRAGVCDPTTGACSNPALADGTECDDGDVCNGMETCSGGACVAGTAMTCDDGVECTSDVCDAIAGCVYTPVADGASCSAYCNGRCSSGVCAATMEPCACPGDCSGHGACDVAHGVCECDEGFTGAACDESVHKPVVEDLSIYDKNNATEVVELLIELRPDGTYTWEDVLADDDKHDDFKPKVPVLFRVVTGQEYGYENKTGHVITEANGLIQRRGAASRSETPYNGFKVKLSKENSPKRWRSMRIINLNKVIYDRSRMRNKLAMDMWRDTPNIGSFRTYHAMVTIKHPDGTLQSLGLYTGIEQGTGHWMEKHALCAEGAGDSSWLYKAQSFRWYNKNNMLRPRTDPLYNKDDFESLIEPKTDNTDDAPFVDMVNDVQDVTQSFVDVVHRHFNVDNFVTWIAGNLLLRDNDHASLNYYVWRANGTQTWYIHPWDYDDGLWPGNNHYRPEWKDGVGNYWNAWWWKRFFVEYPNAVQLVTDKMTELHNSSFSVESARQKIEVNIAAMAPYIQDDIWPGFHGGYQRTETDVMLAELANNYPRQIAKLQEPMPVHQWYYYWADYSQLHEIEFNPSFSLQGRTVTYQLRISTAADMEPQNVVYNRTLPQANDLYDEMVHVIPAATLNSGQIYWLDISALDSEGNKGDMALYSSGVDGACAKPDGSDSDYPCFRASDNDFL